MLSPSVKGIIILFVNIYCVLSIFTNTTQVLYPNNKYYVELSNKSLCSFDGHVIVNSSYQEQWLSLCISKDIMCETRNVYFTQFSIWTSGGFYQDTLYLVLINELNVPVQFTNYVNCAKYLAPIDNRTTIEYDVSIIFVYVIIGVVVVGIVCGICVIIACICTDRIMKVKNHNSNNVNVV